MTATISHNGSALPTLDDSQLRQLVPALRLLSDTLQSSADARIRNLQEIIEELEAVPTTESVPAELVRRVREMTEWVLDSSEDEAPSRKVSDRAWDLIRYAEGSSVHVNGTFISADDYARDELERQIMARLVERAY